MTSKRETFTVWMKSLVFHGNGCTVFDTNGEIVYRIDNYEKIRSNEVYLMDLKGKVLFSIRRKKVILPFFSYWDIYKWSCCGCKENKERRTPWFQARKKSRSILGRDTACRVTLGRHDKATSNGGYTILGLAGNLSFKITDSRGQLVAEVKQKQLSSGVMLGDDVLTMVVEAQIDHSLVMALVTVYGLMRERFE
ncbi:hypothetical protein RHSIM_Rhsim02G0226100 [Rhododendron simsii]|uniref:Uncharacterized protein n=1 Tax=Rhododendron simsii TaxID=118357 RepID=A0A834HE77_RHOSS|nr:hypothetical protein RHSIM_Rhsim02G0226100 [Rhododendron simsii]